MTDTSTTEGNLENVYSAPECIDPWCALMCLLTLGDGDETIFLSCAIEKVSSCFDDNHIHSLLATCTCIYFYTFSRVFLPQKVKMLAISECCSLLAFSQAGISPKIFHGCAESI